MVVRNLSSGLAAEARLPNHHRTSLFNALAVTYRIGPPCGFLEAPRFCDIRRTMNEEARPGLSATSFLPFVDSRGIQPVLTWPRNAEPSRLRNDQKAPSPRNRMELRGQRFIILSLGSSSDKTEQSLAILSRGVARLLIDFPLKIQPRVRLLREPFRWPTANNGGPHGDVLSGPSTREGISVR